MLPQFAVAALNYWSWLDQWQSTNGMVSIFVAHHLVRSILVLVTYTLLTGGKEKYIDFSSVWIVWLLCGVQASVVPFRGITWRNRSVPFRKIMTTAYLGYLRYLPRLCGKKSGCTVNSETRAAWNLSFYYVNYRYSAVIFWVNLMNIAQGSWVRHRLPFSCIEHGSTLSRVSVT